MEKKKITLWCCIILLATGTVIYQDRVSNGITQAWLQMAKRQVQHSSSIAFSYAGIDSLFAANKYRYFIFIKKRVDKPVLRNNQPDSVLLIVSDALPSSFEKQNKHRIFVPESAFNFLMKKNDPIQIYQITGFENRDFGNLYKLTKTTLPVLNPWS